LISTVSRHARLIHEINQTKPKDKTMNLHTEARTIAMEAINESRDYDCDVQDHIFEACDSHEVAIYYYKAIQFCAYHDTSEGEAWLEAAGGISQEGDTLGAFACRVAFATLYCAAMDALTEIEAELEDAE